MRAVALLAQLGGAGLLVAAAVMLNLILGLALAGVFLLIGGTLAESAGR